MLMFQGVDGYKNWIGYNGRGEIKSGEWIVYGGHIHYDDERSEIETCLDLTHYRYPQCFIFVSRLNASLEEVKEKTFRLSDEKAGKSVLKDMLGKKITIDSVDVLRYFYNANSYLSWTMKRNKNSLLRNSQLELEVKELRGQVELLKGILVEQGSRRITPEQAKILGKKN